MLKALATILLCLTLAACATPDAPKVAEPAPACVTVEQVAADMTVIEALEGADAARFFAATGGGESGLPAPHVLVVFEIPTQPDFVFVVIFRDGCAYGRRVLAREDFEREARASLGLRA